MSILNNSINSMNNTIGTNEISIDYFGLEPISIGVFTNDFGNTIFKYMCSNLFIWKIFQYGIMLIKYELEFKKNLIKIFLTYHRQYPKVPKQCPWQIWHLEEHASVIFWSKDLYPPGLY